MRVIFGIVPAIAIWLVACGPSPTPKEEFPGNWQKPTAEVMRTLASNRIVGCGEFYQKKSVVSSGTFAVACTRDERIWKAYLVWPAIDEVIGPDDMLLYQVGGPPFGIDINGKRVDFSEIE